MRILHVNKFLYRRGGAEGYMLDVAAAQERGGHHVGFFAMDHPENITTPFAELFPSYVEFSPQQQSASDRLKAVGRMMYSSSANRGMDAVVERFRPDVVHLHNIYHQLSPSILRPLRKNRIPAVMTLHDFKLACPTYRFLAGGEICEACLGGGFHNAIRKRCNNGSLLASTVSAAEMTLHTRLSAYSPVQIFVCPSEFMRHKMTQGNVFPERLRVLPNMVGLDHIEPRDTDGTSVIFFGRLSREKGVDVLIEAARLADLQVHIAGDGPERAALEEQARRIGADATFHGHLLSGDLHKLIETAAASVVPSRWYENQPLAIIESFALGIPVVGSRLGGIPELIDEGETGLLIPPNDAPALAQALAGLVKEPTLAREMGRKARARFELRFGTPEHLAGLDEIYAEATRLATTGKAAR